jgi:hypothetical protein
MCSSPRLHAAHTSWTIGRTLSRPAIARRVPSSRARRFGSRGASSVWPAPRPWMADGQGAVCAAAPAECASPRPASARRAPEEDDVSAGAHQPSRGPAGHALLKCPIGSQWSKRGQQTGQGTPVRSHSKKLADEREVERQPLREAQHQRCTQKALHAPKVRRFPPLCEPFARSWSCRGETRTEPRPSSGYWLSPWNSGRLPFVAHESGAGSRTPPGAKASPFNAARAAFPGSGFGRTRAEC